MENSKNYKNCTMFLSDDDDDDDDDDNMCFVEKDNQFVEVKQNNVKSNENYSANCSTPSESKLSEPTSSESKLSEPTSSESKMTPLCEQLTYEMCGGSIAELVKTRKRSCKNMSFEVETPQMQVPDKRVRKNSKDSDSLLNKTSEEKSIKPLRGKQIQKVKKKLIKSTMFSNNERFNQENDAGENSSVRQGDQSLSIQTVTSKGKVPSSVDVTKDSSSDLPRNETNVTGERWGVKISRENEQFFCKSTVYNDLSHSTLVVQKLTVGRTKKSSKKTKTNDNNRAHTDITSTMPSIQNSAVKSVRPSNARKTIKGIEKRTDVSSQLIGNTLNVDLPNCTTNQVSKDTVKTTVHFQPQLESNTSKDINKKTSHSNARKTIKGLDKYPSFPSKPISSIQNQNSSSEFSSTQTSKLDQVKISARKDFSIDVLSDDDIEIIHVSTDNKNCDGNSSKSCFQSKDKSALLQSAINNDKSISKETSLEVITHSHINARKSINILRKPSNISRLRSIPNIQSHYNLDENVSSENSEVTQAKATTSKEVSNSISSGEDEIQIIDIIRIKEPANNSLGTIPSKNFSCTKEKSKDHDKSIGVPSEPLNIENRCCEKRAVAQKPKKITQTKTLSNEMQDSAALSFEDGEKELEIIDERIKGKTSSNIPMQNILNVNQNLVPLQPEVASKTSKKLRSNQRNSKGKKAVKGVDENSNLLCASTSNSKNEIYLKETISAQDSKATHVITPSSNIIPFNNQKEVDNVHPKNCHSNSKVDENISQLNLFVVEQSNVTNRTARKKSTSHILRAKKRFTNSSKYLSTQCPSNSEESCDSDATTIAPAFNLNQSGTGNAASTFNDEIESDEDNSVNSKIIDCIATLDEDISVAQPGLLVDGDKLNETEKISNSKARKTFRAAESNIPSKLVDRNHENASPNTQDFKFKKAKLSSLKRNNKKKHEVINEVGEARKFDAAHNVPSLNPSDVSNNKKSNKTCGESKKRVSQKKAKEFDVYENFIRELSIDNSNSSESSVTVTAQKTKLNKAKRVCGKATKSNPERNRKNKDVNKLQITEACDTRLDEKVLGIQMEATSCLQQTDIKGPANKMSQTKKRNIPKAKKRLKEMNKHTGDTVNSDLIKEKRDFDPLPATQLLKSNSIVNDSNNKTDINLESVLLIAQKINKDSGKETKSVHNSVNSQNKNENRDIESYLYNSDQSNDNPSTSIESKLLQNRAKPHNELIKSVPALHKEIVDVFKPNTARKSSTVSMCRPQNISIESLDFKVLSDKMLTTDISKSIRRVEKIIEKNDDVENFLYNSKLEKEHHRNPKVAIATPGFDVNQRPSNVLENKNSTNIKIETINLDEDEEAQTHRMVVNDLQHTLANKPKSIPFLGTVNSNPNAIKQELADMTVSHEKPSKGLFNSEWAPVFATNDNLLIKSEEKQAYVCESNKIPLRRESSTDSVKQIEPTFSTLYDSDSNEENKTDDVITPANMCEPISSSESNYSESVEKCEVSSEKQFKISFNPINSGKWNSVQDSLDSPSLSKFDQDIAEEKPFDSSISTQELVSILNTATACIVIPNRYQHNDLQRDVTTSELFCNKPKTFQSTICASKSSKTECADLKEQKLLECAKQCVVKVMQASISPSSENVHNIDAREQISAHATIDIFSDKVSFHAEQQHLVSNPGDVKNLKYLPSSSLTITDLQKKETLNRNKDLKNESELPKRYSKESFCLKSESFSSDISSEASKACLRCTDKWKCHKHSWSSVAEKAYSRRSRSREKRKRHSWSHSQSKNVSPGCKSNEKQTSFFSETRNAEPQSVSRLSNSSKNDGVISPPLSNEHKPSNRSRSRERKHHEISCAQKRSSSQGKTASNEKESTSAESTRSSDKTSKFPIRERRGPSSNTVQKHNLSRSRSRSGSPKIDICKEKETDRKAPDNSKSLLAENEKHCLSRSHSKDRKYYKPSGSRHISPTRSPSRDSRFTESSRNQNKDYRSRRRSLSRSRDCRSRWRPRSRSRNYEHRKRSRSRSGDSSSHKRSRSRSRDYRTYKRSRSRSRDRRHNRRSRSRNRSSSPINKTSAERCDSISKTIDSKDCSQLDNISESSKNSKSNLTSRKRHDSKSRSKERKHRRLTCPRNKERKSQELSRSRSRSFSPRNKTRDDKCSSPSKAVTLDSSNLSDITSSSESWTSENSKKKYFDSLLSEKRKSRSHSRSQSRSSSSRSRSRSSSSRVNLDESHSWSQIIHEPNQRRVIYLNGIPDSYTDDELSYRFSRFGYIEDVHIVKRQFCRDNNYGFLTYRNTQDAVKAIKHGNDPPFEPKFSITFGDRRSFLQNKVYVDLDKAEEKKRPMNFSDNNSSVPEETEFDVALNAALQRAGLPLRKLVSEKPDESLVFSEPNVP